MVIENAGYYRPIDSGVSVVSRRGVDYCDAGNNLVLVAGDCQKVLKALLEVTGTPAEECTNYGEVVSGDTGYLFVYRLLGHDWTIIDAPMFQPLRLLPWVDHSLAETVSAITNTKSIHYRYTGLDLSYSFYYKGSLIERFLSISKGDTYLLDEYEDVSEEELFVLGDIQRYFYASPMHVKRKLESYRSKKLSQGEKSNLSFFFANLLIEKSSLYIPCLTWNSCSEKDTVTLAIEGLTRCDFEMFSCVPCHESLK